MYYVYVIQSKRDKHFYTGFTRDLKARVIDHNAGRVPSTKERSPFDLIYYEACLNEQDALAREKYLKSGMGKRYLKNRLRRFLSLTGQVEEPKVPYLTKIKRIRSV
jgi:putative endonuclease